MGQEKAHLKAIEATAEEFGRDFARLVRKYLPHFPSNIEESALLHAMRLQCNVYSIKVWTPKVLHPHRIKPIPKRRRKSKP